MDSLGSLRRCMLVHGVQKQFSLCIVVTCKPLYDENRCAPATKLLSKGLARTPPDPRNEAFVRPSIPRERLHITIRSIADCF